MKKNKLEKARKRRKDFEKRRNLKNRNGQKALQRGRVLRAGDGILPESKKRTLSKAEKAELEEQRKLRNNTLADVKASEET